MKENGKSKREWVKTAAIVFLSVMLVLTFFSNTFMNYSLPEVATQYVMSDSITARIRGTGTVESGDPYEVMVNESRKVASVAVRVGDEVERGDVLFYLEDSESDELKAARKALADAEKVLNAAQDDLRDARDNYNAALLNGDITAEDIKAANSGTSASAYRQQMTAIQARITEAENELKPYDETLANLAQMVANIDAQTTYEEHQLEVARANLAAAEGSVSGNDGDDSKLAAARKAVDDINASITNLSNQKSALNLQIYITGRDRDEVNKKLEAAKKELEDLTIMLGKVQTLDGLKDLISDAQEVVSDAQKGVDEVQEEIRKLEEKAFGATITADISGTVTSINVTAGNTTSTMTPVAVLQPEGQGYTMSFSVTNDQARRLAVGDRADLVNAWRYDDVNVVLASIRPDKDDPAQKKMLTFDVTGGVIAGQTLSISVGQQSANFDLVVPNSAIREDNNGKFILIVETRPSPLGNRYAASRVDVEVLASDDTKSAISGALYGYEYVITTSTQPVEAGQLVRLANN